MPNKHILFLIDCCYSGYGLTRSTSVKKRLEGGNIQEYLNAITSVRAVQLLTAGGKNDLAHEREGHGIFTSCLLDVLKGKTSHKDDGVISTLEMSSYIKQNVINQTKGRQNPAFGYLLGNGDVVFITGKQDRKISYRQELLSLEEIGTLGISALELKKKGEYLNAERKMSKAYTHFRRHHSKDTAKQIVFLKCLVIVSNDMKKNDMSIYYARELLETSDEKLDHSFAYNSMGLAYCNKGNYDSATEYLQKALKIQLDKLEPEHPDVATAYSNLGEAYHNKGDYDSSIKYYQKAMKITVKRLRKNNPYIKISGTGNLEL